MKDDLVERLRYLLGLYDEGLITNGEVGSRLLEELVQPHMEQVAIGQESGWGCSVCGGEDNPPILQRAIIEVGALGKPVWFRPLSDALSIIAEGNKAGREKLTGKTNLPNLIAEQCWVLGHSWAPTEWDEIDLQEGKIRCARCGWLGYTGC